MSDIEIERGTGNVYADLGRPNAEEMKIKARLAMRINAAIKDKGLTQMKAAELIGMPQPKLSELLRGKFSGISEAKMIECLNKLGNDVEIVITTAREAQGHTSVIFA
jgi:predicted XRE-type DNA-binding protein